MREPNEQYTYYRVEFKNCSNVEFDYTIVENIKEIESLIKGADMDLDDDECEALIEIRGVAMTPKQFEQFLEDCKDDEEG